MSGATDNSAYVESRRRIRGRIWRHLSADATVAICITALLLVIATISYFAWRSAA